MEPMILKFNTSINKTVTIPVSGKVDVKIDWGDGQYVCFNDNTLSVKSIYHTFEEEKEYLVKITGSLENYGRYSNYNNENLIEVLSFGDLGIKSLSTAFNLAKNLISVPEVLPPTVKNLSDCFVNAIKFNCPNICKWDTSNVTNMQAMFKGCAEFNQPIGIWKTRKVENMRAMFFNAVKFNQPVGKWAVSKVKDLSFMFYNAKSFNQPLKRWKVKGKDVEGIFFSATAFSQDISSWAFEGIEEGEIFAKLKGLDIVKSNQLK